MSAASRQRLRELLQEAEPDVVEVNLLIACEAYPKMDLDRWLDRVRELGRAARDRGAGVDGVVEVLRDTGLAGDRATYDDPRNSYLNEVLDRRTGLPIALSVLTVAVAQHAGLDVRPVALPGHVIVVDLTGPVARYLDPFDDWSVRTVEECGALVTGTFGIPFDSAYLQPTPGRLIIRRMLANVTASYARRDEFDDVRWTLELAAIVDPDDPAVVEQLRALDDLR